MPLSQFICPDGQRTVISNCLAEGGCRLKKRCMSRATLIYLGKQREWKGIPSVTQLLRGTLESYLMIKNDYAEDPDDGFFKLFGTNVHKLLEMHEEDKMYVEKTYVTSHGISMTPDLLEIEGGWNVLTDYKVSGSYKIMNALGAYIDCVDSPTEVYKQKTSVSVNGVDVVRLKGEPKILKLTKFDINRQDCIDWVRQMNYYRIGYKEQGLQVNEMRIQAIVRDGGTISAYNRGLNKRGYLIPIPELPDSEIIDYFLYKRYQLMEALAFDQVGAIEKCNDEECWGGRKCENFCSVKEFCPFQKEDNKWVKSQT